MTPQDSHNYLSLAGDKRAVANRRRTMSMIVLIVAIFVGYAGFQMQDVLFSPDLEITSPSDGATVTGSVTIRGVVSPGSDLNMDGYHLAPAKDGTVSADLPLANGFHVLTFEAKSSLGKVSRVSRQIVVQ